MTKHRLRALSVIAAMALVSIACGQKPGVHEQLANTGATNDLGAGTTSGTTATGGTTADSANGGTDAGSSPSDTGPEAPADGGGGAPAPVPSGPQDRTGVTADAITIGIHAPVTGAAPFPAEAFALGREVYWKWSGAPKIHNRTVKVLFEDDQYSPVTARDRCRKMAEQQNSFLLIGGGGTDQIQACGQYAASKGIPYLSPGVTEIGLDNLPNYFAFSMTYAQQAELLWQMIMKDSRLSPNSSNVAMIRTDTPNFDDAHDAFVSAAEKNGKTLVLDRTLPKNPSQTDYNSAAQQLASSGAQIVHILVAPTHYVLLTAQLPSGYRPWWIGGGITMGLNAILETGCSTSQNAMDKGLFFSPIPGLDKIDSIDPNYRKAYREVNGGAEPDDIGLILWGLNKTLHQMFDKAGQSLSRQSFISSVQSSSFETKLYPPQKYSPQNHLGGTQVHLLKADCGASQYRTEKTFVSGF